MIEKIEKKLLRTVQKAVVSSIVMDTFHLIQNSADLTFEALLACNTVCRGKALYVMQQWFKQPFLLLLPLERFVPGKHQDNKVKDMPTSVHTM